MVDLCHVTFVALLDDAVVEMIWPTTDGPSSHRSALSQMLSLEAIVRTLQDLPLTTSLH